MPAKTDEGTYYRTAEVCRMVGIGRNTLFKWLKKGILPDAKHRDWWGWRLFTTAKVETIRTKAYRVIAIGRNS